MRNRRKAVSLLTGLLVTAQLFPTAALAADSSESALNKAPDIRIFPPITATVRMPMTR